MEQEKKYPKNNLIIQLRKSSPPSPEQRHSKGTTMVLLAHTRGQPIRFGLVPFMSSNNLTALTTENSIKKLSMIIERVV